MSIFVIADLHLSFNHHKPMDIFGENWVGHEEKIRNNWIEKVKENDLVVLPGDFSWETYLENTKLEFEYLNALPGKKLLLKGNHDYWWTTITNMREFLKENNFTNIDFLYNNSYEFENKILCGTRGWSVADEEMDKKLINRELIRLELSLQDGVKKYGKDKEIIVFMHYPPITKALILSGIETKFVDLMKKYNVKRCYYGHLHGTSIYGAIEGEREGIQFKLVSADGLDFDLIKI
jgi:hypothetical protein